MIPHPDEDGTQLWLIHGGKRQGGSVMGDLWQATVRWPDVSWELLDSGPEADGEGGGQGDRWRSHAPAARRGHAAVMVPGSPPRLVRCSAGLCIPLVLPAAAALMNQQHADGCSHGDCSLTRLVWWGAGLCNVLFHADACCNILLDGIVVQMLHAGASVACAMLTYGAAACS